MFTKLAYRLHETLLRNQRRGLLIASGSGSSISLFVFSDLVVFDKVSTAIRITADMLNWQYLMIGQCDREHFF